MTTNPDRMSARKYLLGLASDEEIAAVEQAYFGRGDALDTIETAEEELIEDYLEDRLGEDERGRFERHYLATSGHRVRVDTIRRLKTAARPAAAPIPLIPRAQPIPRPSSRAGIPRTLAWAAGLVMAIGGGVWVVERTRSTREPATPPIGATTPPPIVPRVFAMALSPAAVRSVGDTATLVIPAGTDVIDLRLEGEPGDRPLARGRVAIRKVSGDDIWQGPTAAPVSLPAGVIAQAEVPASRLQPDDYVVALYETGLTGAESERHRYFLRVRAR